MALQLFIHAIRSCFPQPPPCPKLLHTCLYVFLRLLRVCSYAPCKSAHHVARFAEMGSLFRKTERKPCSFRSSRSPQLQAQVAGKSIGFRGQLVPLCVLLVALRRQTARQLARAVSTTQTNLMPAVPRAKRGPVELPSVSFRRGIVSITSAPRLSPLTYSTLLLNAPLWPWSCEDISELQLPL
jgi:hypothetical protein